MKKITFLFTFLLSFAVFGQETITQSTSMELAEDNTMVSCQMDGNDPEIPTTASDNKYFRYFEMADYGIESAWDVQSVQFGIQGLNIPSLPNGFPLRVKIYMTAENSFPGGFPDDFTQVGSAVFVAEEGDNETLVTVPIEATINTDHNMLVEIGYDAQEQGSGNRIFLASNAEGQTAPTYLMSEGCSIVNPTATENVGNGFPDVHLILGVTGEDNLSINNPALNAVSVYPNPAKDVLNLSLPQNVQVEKATLTDMTGKEIQVSVTNNTMDISRFTTGIYVLTLSTNEGFATRKIVKE